MTTDTARVRAQVAAFAETWDALTRAIQTRIHGQDVLVQSVLTAFFAGGHVLLEGVPGIGKTALVRALSDALAMSSGRVQCTPDLMPADIVGGMVLDQGMDGARQLRFEPGPAHVHLLLADEINRASPKTQSALLEAMQERQITVGGTSHPLPDPFLVLATQNPIEQSGTYPLPEAQLDRFFFKLHVGYPEERFWHDILATTTGREEPALAPCANAETVRELQGLVRDVPSSVAARELAVRLVLATQPDQESAPAIVRQSVQFGASPRGAQALLLAGKVHALRDGRHAVEPDDVRIHAREALRHRLVLRFEAIGDGVTADTVLQDVLRA